MAREARTAGIARAERIRENRGALLIGPGRVVTPDAVLNDAGVLAHEGRISAVDDFARLRDDRGAGAEWLDARGGLILPGLINAHTHFYSALAVGLRPRGAAPASFTETLERVWWRLDRALSREDIRLSAQVAAIRCIECGVTTVVDHQSSPPACAGSLDEIRAAVEETGIRAALCYEVSDRDGPERAAAGIAENLRFIRALRAAPSPRLAALFGMHALFTLSEETLTACVAAARGAGVGVHLHVSEDRVDVARALAAHGERPVQRLARHGALDARAVLAHCVHVDSGEIDLLAQTRAFVVHNPESNLKNAVGYAPVTELLARGARVCLGTDGMSPDLLGTARAAYLLQRHESGDPRVRGDETVRSFWQHNAALAAQLFDVTLGTLAPGAAADLTVLDYHPPSPLEAANLIGHLIFGFGARHVVATVVAGQVLMRDRRILTVEKDAVLARAREQARGLWERL